MEVNESVHEISPSPPSHPRSPPPRPPRPPRTPRDNSFYAQDPGPISRRVCVYCDRETQRYWECDSLTSPAERRRILQSKRLCFNCTGTQHNASKCRSRTSCVHCKQRHHSSICDCSTMDVLGLEDKPNGDQSVVYEEFIKQLSRSPEDWYETGLLWKGDHPPLPSNNSGSLKRLGSLVQRLKKTGKLDDYDAIIQ